MVSFMPLPNKSFPFSLSLALRVVKTRMALVSVALSLVFLAEPPTATAEVAFNVTYLDVTNTTGNGFNDATLGATRQSTFESVFTYINTVVDHSGTVEVEVKESQTDGDGFLAAAGAAYPTSPPGFENGEVFRGANGTGLFTGSDMGVTFDFGFNWNSDTSAPSGSEFDLFTVALHEITHGMGFSSLVTSTGISGIGEPGTNPGIFSVYDTFLELGNGTPLFSAGGNFDGSTGDLISDDIFFDGTNARQGNGGQPIKIFAPGSFQEGSSISHIDSSLSTAVMNPTVGTGVSKREYTTADLGILADIGWNLSASASASLNVPEPSTWALAVLTFCSIFAVRRKASGRSS